MTAADGRVGIHHRHQVVVIVEVHHSRFEVRVIVGLFLLGLVAGESAPLVLVVIYQLVIQLIEHIAVAFAGAFIRLGNLFNSEIYGDVTSLPWGFIFDLRGETEPKHPTQLYEAGSYLLLGFLLLGLYKAKLDKLYRGTFIGLFFIGCFGARFLIEFIKEPQVGFEEGMALNMGQLLSIPFILLGIFFLWYAWKKKIPARAVHPEKPVREQTHYAHAK